MKHTISLEPTLNLIVRACGLPSKIIDNSVSSITFYAPDSIWHYEVVYFFLGASGCYEEENTVLDHLHVIIDIIWGGYSYWLPLLQGLSKWRVTVGRYKRVWGDPPGFPRMTLATWKKAACTVADLRFSGFSTKYIQPFFGPFLCWCQSWWPMSETQSWRMEDTFLFARVKKLLGAMWVFLLFWFSSGAR